MKKWLSGVRAKLLIISSVGLASLIVVGVVCILAILNLSHKLDDAYNQRLKMSEELGNIDAGMHASMRWLWTATAYENDQKERQHYGEKAREEIKEIDRAMGIYFSIPKSAKSQDIISKKFIPNWEASKKIYEEVINRLEKNDAQAVIEGKNLIINKLRLALAPATEADLELQKIADEVNVKVVSEALSYAKNVEVEAVIILILGVFFSIGASVYIANRLIKSLLDVSGELKNSSTEVSSAATQIASASEELSQSTMEQAASLEETSSSIHEVSVMVAKNSENANEASRDSMSSQQRANRGREVVNTMITSIHEISDSNEKIMQQIEQSNQEISEIVKVISEIGNKTKVINDIVFQTKLLSFNASVEAARAGEHGKGFAVVAEEVGNLAHMSGKASGEISEMLDTSIKTVERIVFETNNKVQDLVKAGKLKVDVGIKVSQECGRVLEEIVASVSSVSSMANEIAVSSQQQSVGVADITKTMHTINLATQQNSTVANQSASAAEQLSVQAQSLQNLVQILSQTIEG
jgi:methyl-accepting chemotaxis protein